MAVSSHPLRSRLGPPPDSRGGRPDHVTDMSRTVNYCSFLCASGTERIRVFVARSRHKNAVERNRGADRYGILIQPGPLDEKICADLGGECRLTGGMKECGSWGD